MDERLVIRKLKREDCLESARIRFEEKYMGFLPVLGVNFYSELLKGTCNSKWGFGIVCLNEKELIVGFLYAVTDLKKYYIDIIIRRGIFLFFFAFMKVMKKPDLIFKIIPYLTYPKTAPYSNIKAQWLTMIIRKEFRKKGVGKKLTLSLTDEFKKRRITQYKSTVPSDNRASCLLHEKLGFTLLGTFDLGGESLNIYKYEI